MFVAPYLEKVPYHPVNDIKMIMQFAAFNMGEASGLILPSRAFRT
jgi:hypothetical protein